MTTERRRRRSPDPLVALHYQLSTIRQEAALDTVVVADGSGVVVAGAGSWGACEELAAFAPFGSRESGEGAVVVHGVDVDGQRVLLCAAAERDAGHVRAALERAAPAVSRILAA